MSTQIELSLRNVICIYKCTQYPCTTTNRIIWSGVEWLAGWLAGSIDGWMDGWMNFMYVLPLYKTLCANSNSSLFPKIAAHNGNNATLSYVSAPLFRESSSVSPSFQWHYKNAAPYNQMVFLAVFIRLSKNTDMFCGQLFLENWLSLYVHIIRFIRISNTFYRIQF